MSRGTRRTAMVKPSVLIQQCESRRTLSSPPTSSSSALSSPEESAAAAARGPQCLTTMPLLLLTALLYASLTTGECLEFLGLEVPKVVDPRREEVSLRCDYDLGNEELYSVKWYKDGDEFFNFMPSTMPMGREYDVEGVKVDVGRSDSRRVILLGQSQSPRKRINFAGQYGCEVSVEAPSYSTAFGTEVITVAVLPHQDPALDGLRLRSHYDVGDVLRVNCTSAPSYPRALLTFLLNHKEVSKSLTKELPSVEPVEGNVVSSARLGMVVKLGREHFPGGNLSLICRSTMPEVPGAEIRSTETIITPAASNQRLAQEPPKSGAIPIQRVSMFLQISVIVMMNPLSSIISLDV